MAEQMMQEAAGKAIPAGYKQTEVGVIPEEWDVATIEELADIIDPQPDHRTPPESSNGEPYIGISDFINSREVDWTASRKIISKAVDKQEKCFQLQKGDIVFGKIGTIGVPKFVPQVPFRFALSANVILLHPKNVESIYLMGFFYSESFQKTLKSELHSTSQAAFGMNKMRLIKLPLPPKEEQTAIANVLSDTDALIGTLEQLIAKKQAIKTATMQQLLTGRTRLPQFALRPDGTPKGYKYSELGQIPEDWNVNQLSDLCSLKSGLSITSQDIDDSGSYRCFGGNGLRGYTKEFTHDGDFVLIGRQGALCGNIQCVSGRFFASEHALVATLGKLTNSKWIAVYLERMNLNQYSESSAQPGLSAEKLRVLKLITPTSEEQTAIGNVLSDMDSELNALEQKLAKARDLKQGMMQQLLTGRIRLPLPQEA
ncbi:TPA: restriction endonuclease subunit S [Aeromonas hydrophila]|uniref:Restriction endonuclease subunit S n=1 Tax=Aeromonas hydrophila TaxID=644 RepID=A0AAD3UBI0_AERHY|nr:restriction endonuclease subunit S [Aeromonas hydrophila]